MSISENYSEILKNVARGENVLDPQIGFPQATNKGDGYMGNMCFIEIKGTNKTLHVALKSATENEQIREQLKIHKVFKNEILFYSEVSAIFERIQGSVENPFVPPKCYRTSLEIGEEHLILENLKKAGYAMWDRRNLMDRDHVVLVFKQYAKLHALSYVLKEKDAESFNFIKDNVFNISVEYLKDEENNEAFRKIAGKIVDVVPETFKDEERKRRFLDLCDNFPKYFKEAFEPNQDTVLCHGDCWCNNMIFKYEEGKLTDMRLLDFQIIRMANPVLDLSYFLYTSTSREIYDDIEDLLRVYHNALIEHAKNLGVEITLSFEQLGKYWEKFAKTGLFLAFVIVKVLLADGDDDTPDIASATDKGGVPLDAFNYEAKHDKEYYRRLNELVLHCYENGFL